MSRVGKKPMTLPQGVDAVINGRVLNIKGPKGALDLPLPDSITATLDGKELTFSTADVGPRGARRLSPVWGTTRALASNMVTGVTQGYSIVLNLVGVGYRASMAGSKLNMTLGYSHPIEMDVPQGIAVEVKDQTTVTVTGIDKQQVGEFAANVRSKRPPEPFKGKGVKYANETIIMKEGKKK